MCKLIISFRVNYAQDDHIMSKPSAIFVDLSHTAVGRIANFFIVNPRQASRSPIIDVPRDIRNDINLTQRCIYYFYFLGLL